jgi:hypothetical protein
MFGFFARARSEDAVNRRSLNPETVQDDGQQPPDFLILATRASSAWSSGTSLKHFSRHSNNLRWNGVLTGAKE